MNRESGYGCSVGNTPEGTALGTKPGRVTEAGRVTKPGRVTEAGSITKPGWCGLVA
ncbi:hypothetical protein [Paenibacillus lautus]|uniref:hypothetical protein n=1 Tax=Paenibacillus lautus TaxID=1401 RepID=UPI002DB79BB4|nr:hypothetical protein [Paenibacillus lautus]MEC0254172.1 hypothetical protein [Paenibacillus lautus]